MSGYDEYLNDRYNDPPSTTNVTKDKDHRTKLSWDDIWHTNVQQCREVVRFRQKNANWILVAMETARGAMPPKPKIESRYISKRHSNLTSDDKLEEKIFTSSTESVTRFRIPRIPGVGQLLGGALGTFLGLYNLHRIQQLGSELEDVKVKHNKLVEIVDDHHWEINRLNQSLAETQHYIRRSQRLNPTFLSQTFDYIENRIYRQLQTVVHSVQMAQVRRLSVDILDAGQLYRLFHKLQREAYDMNNILLIDRPSDLFQLEVTYFSDGQDVHLLVHVPSVPQSYFTRPLQTLPFSFTN